jgi:hypothetical protein
MDIPCPNYEVCESLMDPRMRTCGNCSFRRIVLKKNDLLSFKDDIECPVCLDTKRGLQGLNCNHYVCIDCFKECHKCGDDDQSAQPPFPYDSNIEEDYDENPEKYDGDPIIKVWEDCMSVYCKEKEDEYETRSNLRLCPLCRK